MIIVLWPARAGVNLLIFILTTCGFVVDEATSGLVRLQKFLTRELARRSA